MPGLSPASTSLVYLTPASISYLTQFILSLAITVFVAHRLRRRRDTSLVLLCGFFAAVTVFIGLLFLDAALAPFPRLLAVYAENTVLALALVFLLQFAYRFPRFYARRTWEARASLIVSLAYLAWEGQFAVYRYVSLLQQGNVYYRGLAFDYANALVLLWAPMAFLRQCIAADPRPVNALSKLANPHGKEARGARAFFFVFSILFVLGAVNVLRGHAIVSTTFYNASLSIGILVALWLFASNYINFIPGGASVLAKLSILTLTLFLVMLGSVVWMMAPPYAYTYRPDLADHQTLRFTPDPSGGYSVAPVAFHFESSLGDRLPVQSAGEARNHKIDFAFPFYGQTYTELYAVSSGAISMGQLFWQPNVQARSLNTPAIFPLLMDFDPTTVGGGLYARQEAGRLVLTWYRLPAQYRPEAVFTFQAVLYSNGVFDLTYNGLPAPLRYDPDASPSANPWLRGATPGWGEPLHVQDRWPAPLPGSHLAIIENYYLDFRCYLHEFILPLAWVIVGGSLLLMLGLPVLMHYSLVKPLSALSAGVQQMEAGHRHVQVAIESQDEIGFLAQAFNTMAARLGELVTSLEERVAERTSNLFAANQRLRAEMEAREDAQAQILEHQRELAALGERERIGRELHDGLGQVMGYINLEAQAAQALLAEGQTSAVQANLERMARVAQDAHADIRNYILGLRPVSPGGPRLCDAVRAYLRQFSQSHHIETALSWPPDAPEPALAPAVEEQALRIIQEALTNVRKHASARRVQVLFSFGDEMAQIIISDDGVGFDAGGPAGELGGHFGLEIMRERAESVGGHLEARSAPGQGAQIIARLPVATQLVSQDDQARRAWRVLLVDDHPLFVDGMRNLIMAHGGQVVGVGHTGLEGRTLALQLRPDVILMDIHMPECDGLEATRQIHAEWPQAKIIMLTVSADDETLFEALKLGAAGYLLKGLNSAEFFALLSQAMRGEVALSPGLAARAWTEFARREPPADAPPPIQALLEAGLTPRQAEVLNLAAQGLTYKEIAYRLSLSERTIRYHMGQILEHLQLTRRQALDYARKKGAPG